MSTNFVVALETACDRYGADCFFAHGIYDGAPMHTGRILSGWGREEVLALFEKLEAHKRANIAGLGETVEETSIWTDVPDWCPEPVQSWATENLIEHLMAKSGVQFGYLLGLDGEWKYFARAHQCGFPGAYEQWALMTATAIK